jgi:flagellar hook-length control protein FliK
MPVAGPIGPAKPVQVPPPLETAPPGIKDPPILPITGAPVATPASPVATPTPSEQPVAAASLPKTPGEIPLSRPVVTDTQAKTAPTAATDMASNPPAAPQAATLPPGNLAAKTDARPRTDITPTPPISAANTSPKAPEAPVKSPVTTQIAASRPSDSSAPPVRPTANPEEESNQEITAVAATRTATARDTLAAENTAGDNEAADDQAADDQTAATAESAADSADVPSNAAGPGDLGADLAALTQSLEPLPDATTAGKSDLFARPVAETSVSQSGNSFASAALQPGLATTAADGPSAAGQAPIEQTGSSNAAPPVTPALQVAVQISRSFNGQGGQSFNIQLKPERLGTVDVKLDIDERGKATATVTADRPETLHLLRQDAHHLIRSLNEAGIAADSSTLSFSLKDTSSGSFNNDDHRFGQGQNGGTGAAPDEATAAEAEPAWTDPNRILDFHA